MTNDRPSDRGQASAPAPPCAAPVAGPRRPPLADRGRQQRVFTPIPRREGRPMGLLHSIRRDIQAARERDPAATSTLEVILAYPGFHARELHRLAHTLHTHRLRL